MSDSIEAIRTNAVAGARQLLVGGLCDPQWDSNRANELATKEVGVEVVEFTDATHFMHAPGDALRSVEIQLEVSRAVDRFLAEVTR